MRAVSRLQRTYEAEPRRRFVGGLVGWFGYEPGMNKKEFLKEKLMQLMFGWECHPHWYKFAHIIELFLYSSLVSTGQFNV